MHITSLFSGISKAAHYVGLNTPRKKLTAAAGLAFALYAIPQYASVDHDRCRVDDPIIKQDRYLVFTTCGVYKNTDTIWWVKYNSSDIQARAAKAAREGYEVDIKSNVWRNWLTSEYPNILRIEPVPANQP